jgi:two-component system chemotaxis sensor kinase CheA
MDEVLREFLLETHENLAQLDLDLVKLETDASDTETISRVFRTLHTVKGTAGFLGLPKLQAVGHAAENLLTKLRAKELQYSPDIASALLAAIDAIRKMLLALENSGSEGEDDFPVIIETLESLVSTAYRTTAPSVASKSSVVAPPFASNPPHPSTVPSPHPPALASQPIQQQPRLSIPAATSVSVAREPPDVKNPASIEILPVAERGPAVSDSALRVDVELLDKLMTLVGELVLARNQIVQFSSSHEDSGFTSTVQRLNLLTTELQANVMKTRMQPIGTMWSKFPRVVRDLSIACGKQVRLEMFGKETELDKSIVEAIRDPLTHLVRNAVDHGIETPAERVAARKPAEGHLVLSASHEGGKVIITLADNGRGINPSSVRDKAIAVNLVSRDQANRMSERELMELIFLPGFSTADKVTHFSGRGVGMDVVRTNVEKIGGSVEIDSSLGRGTTIKMTIPLTLAIIPALIISSGGDCYAIPQLNLIELVRLNREQARKGIEQIPGAEVYRLRDNLLPLVRLNRELQLEESNFEQDDDIQIVVLQADDRQFGLVVDEIHDTEEIVVKPLQRQIKAISVFSGATIMGDGLVALILDVLSLAQRANVIKGVRNRTLADSIVVPITLPRESVLLFSVRKSGRLAVPLSIVARFEEFPQSALERVGNRLVVQYRNQILQLWDVSTLLSSSKMPSRIAGRTKFDGNMQVVVCMCRGELVGLIVDRIIDIVEEVISTKSASHRPGILFTAVVQDKITDFLDVERLIPTVNSDESIAVRRET